MHTDFPTIPVRWALLLTSLPLLWLSPARASACECPAGDPRQTAERSTAIFEGHVVSLATAQDGHREVLFRVTRSWRGPQHETLRVGAPAPATCGPEFEIDRAYVVYARGTDGALHTDRCMGTRPIEEADADLARLGVGSIPVDPPPSDERRTRPAALTGPRDGGCASCTVGGARRLPATTIGLCLVLGLGLLRRRRWRA